jgi:hypothetical protein
MERARQMRRDLITVAVVAVLLGAAMLLISSNATSAQSATEDQYSSATSASASASATSDQYPNGSSGGGAANPTTPAPAPTGNPTTSAPENNTEDPSGTQAMFGALLKTLTTISSCNPFGAYGGLAGLPTGCDMGAGSTNIPGQGGSVATIGDPGSTTFPTHTTRVLTTDEMLTASVCGLNQMCGPLIDYGPVSDPPPGGTPIIPTGPGHPTTDVPATGGQ